MIERDRLIVGIRDRRTILGVPLGRFSIGPLTKFPYQNTEINHRPAYLLDLLRRPRLVNSLFPPGEPLGYYNCTRALTHLAVQEAFDQGGYRRVFGTYTDPDGAPLNPDLPLLDLRIIRFRQQQGFPIQSCTATPEIHANGSPDNKFLTFTPAVIFNYNFDH